VGLHAHSVAGSVFDALGFPDEHMNYCYSNGGEALALTDHGTMAGFSYQFLHAKKMKAEGKVFKPIHGIEAYFIPSIGDWKIEYGAAKKDAKKAKKLTDDGESGATVENEGESKKAVKSILNQRRHLVLLAQNQIGLNNLFSMISESYEPGNFYRYPRVDYDMLSRYSEGVIAASACMGGIFAGNYWQNRDNGPEAIRAAMRETNNKFVEIFGDRWYGELQWNSIPEQHEINKYIIEMHHESGLPLISTADSHYPNPDAWKDRELYKRLGWIGKSKPDWADEANLPVTVDEIGYELYPKNGEQMWEAYKKYSKACGVEYDDSLVMDSITLTHKIAFERIEDFIPDTTVKLPDFVVPAGSTAEEALTNYALDGLRKKNLQANKEYSDRLQKELEVINERGFSKYFLTMKAISDKANQFQLTGTGRGSGAGSLVAYVLEITQIDPIKYGLMFERFLRKDATDYPDIDFDSSEPMKLKDILIKDWGSDTVVPISNWNTLQLKSLIKDVSKFYGIEFVEVNKVTSVMMLEATPPAKLKHDIKAGAYIPTWEEVMEFSPSLRGFLVKYPHIKAHVEALIGQIKSCSRHAGGILVADNLNKYMPIISSGGVRQSPWSEGQNVRHLEPLGFIKFDLLGLGTLRMIEIAIRHILKRKFNNQDPTFEDVKNYYNQNLHPDKIDFDDQNVYENIFRKGNFSGTFQFSDSRAQEFCKNARPKGLMDIAAITAIYRPGPLSANVHEQYVEAKNNTDDIDYINDVYREVTEPTLGFLVFQEQISLLAHKLGNGISLDEANLLRKVLTKKGTGKEAQVKASLYGRFVEGCVEKGMRKVEAEEMWQRFEYFNKYGFNKSHAVAYSAISFQCAWLYNYYPTEWIAAYLQAETEKNKTDKIEVAINLAKSIGFEIQKADVNLSSFVWEIDLNNDRKLVQPLSSLKGLGESAIEQIIDNRPFASVEELLFSNTVVYSKVNKKTLDVLVRSGATDSLMDGRFSGRKHFWSAVAVDRVYNKKKFSENIEKYRPEGSFTSEEEIDNLTTLTGIFPMDLIVTDDVRRRLREKYVPPISDYDPELGLVWFVPREIVKKKTKNGKAYWIITVIDENSVLTKMRCWGIVEGSDRIHINHPYMCRPQYDPSWGFSVRSIKKEMRMLG
jgi:DNA polymerase III subunit alpha